MRSVTSLPRLATYALGMGWVLITAQALASGDADAQPSARTAPDGRLLYQQQCAACHDAAGWGTRIVARRAPEGEAALEDRAVLPASYVTTVVRRGMGSMPPIRRTVVSDDDLAAIAAYLENGA